MTAPDNIDVPAEPRGTHLPATILPAPKQEQFCLEYLKDLNGAQAAIRAGYSPRNAKVRAWQLLSTTAVSARIAELKAARRQRVELDADWVITQLVEVVKRCLQAAPVLDRRDQPVQIEMRNGQWVAGYEFDAAGATRALELLGRHLGILGADKRQPREMELTAEELRRLADERETPEELHARMKAYDAKVAAEFEGLREEWKHGEKE